MYLHFARSQVGVPVWVMIPLEDFSDEDGDDDDDDDDVCVEDEDEDEDDDDDEDDEDDEEASTTLKVVIQRKILGNSLKHKN